MTRDLAMNTHKKVMSTKKEDIDQQNLFITIKWPPFSPYEDPTA
jgi:hypothetical protein